MKKIENKFVNEKLGLMLDVYVDENGKEWFKAQDLSDFLGYRMASDMTRMVTFDDTITTHNMRTGLNNTSTVSFINEMAIYEIVCKITKADAVRYEKAREFQRWVFGEVLPELRKHGAYVMGSTEKEAYENAIAGYKSALKRIAEDQKIAREFADARTKTIDNLNEKIGDLEYKYTEVFMAANDMRFIIGNTFAKANGFDKTLEEMGPVQQEDIFRNAERDMPEFREAWAKIMNIVTAK